MNYKRSEIAAGAFLFISFLIIVALVFAVSDLKGLFKQKKELHVRFHSSDGIEKGAQVRFSGLKVGKVTGIHVPPDRCDCVDLTISILDETVVREDTKASIKSLGLVGGKYVELTGGTTTAQTIGPGGTLIGEEALRLDDLTKMALETVNRLNHIAKNLDALTGDPALSPTIKGTLQNIQAASANIKEITEGKNNVVAALQGLPELMKKVDESANNLRLITANTNSVMQTTGGIIAKTEGVVGQTGQLLGRTDDMVKDNRKRIDEMLESFKEMSKNLKEFTDDIKANPWKLIRKP